MQGRDHFKVKHFIGSYKDQKSGMDDIIFAIYDWYHNENGYNVIHKHRGIEDDDRLTFSDRDIKKILDKHKISEELFDRFIEKSLEKGLIEHHKETGYSNFYKFKKKF